MSKLFLALCCVVGLGLTASQAYGGLLFNADRTITSITHSGAVVQVLFSGSDAVNKDTCASDAHPWFAFSTATNEGKAMLSTLTAAFLAGKRITNIQGTAGNNCLPIVGFMGQPTWQREILETFSVSN